MKKFFIALICKRRRERFFQSVRKNFLDDGDGYMKKFFIALICKRRRERIIQSIGQSFLDDGDGYMKKFFIALIFALIITNFCEAAEFTREQVDQMMTITAQNPAVKKSATLPVDAETFRKNYNDFITNFIRGTSAGTDAFMMERIFTLDELKTFTRDGSNLFAKNFINKVAIVGLSDGDKCKVLNIFAAPLEDQNDALFNVLILQGFINGISPGLDATALLDEIKRSPVESATYNGVRYSVTRAGDLSIVTAVAQ